MHRALCALTVLALLAVPAAQSADEEEQAKTSAGKAIVDDRMAGNCLACHTIAGADLTGNVGPALVAMKQRFPDKAVLRAQIWDPTVRNPESVMPPYGKHGILTEEEIDLVVEYLYSL